MGLFCRLEGWFGLRNSVALCRFKESNVYRFSEAGTELDTKYRAKKRVNVMLFDEGAILCFIGC